MGFADDLFIDIDDTLGGLLAIGSSAQGVNGLKQDDPLHALLSQQVALVAAAGRRAKPSAEHAVATNAHVEHSNLAGSLVLQQTP